MPKEIANELENRFSTKEVKLPIRAESSNSRSKSIQAMRDATDEDGKLTIASLENELSKNGLSEYSTHQLIGQGESEGILLRHGDETWSWLQQSS